MTWENFGKGHEVTMPKIIRIWNKSIGENCLLWVERCMIFQSWNAPNSQVISRLERLPDEPTLGISYAGRNRFNGVTIACWKRQTACQFLPVARYGSIGMWCPQVAWCVARLQCIVARWHVPGTRWYVVESIGMAGIALQRHDNAIREACWRLTRQGIVHGGMR